MSLDWSAKNVANWDSINTEENWPWIQAVIFDAMAVGIREITEANWKEFRRRQFMARVAMGYTHQELKSYAEDAFSEEFIHSLVGLSTNASTLTVTQFNKKLIANMESRVYGLLH